MKLQFESPELKSPMIEPCLLCSMDKLFDLMVMGAKYQLLCSSKLDDMIQAGCRSATDIDGTIGRLWLLLRLSQTQWL